MKKISIHHADNGMVLAEDIITRKGQLIARKGTILNPQLILHMKFYSIDNVSIVDSENEKEDSIEQQNLAIKTQAQRIRASREFQLFSKEYQINVHNMRISLSDFIQRQQPLKCEALLSSTTQLFQSNFTTFGLLDMLHNMRDIDDSTFAHSINVALIARIMGEWMSFPDEDLDVLTLCGLLHDIGKAKVPQEIVLKPGRLTDQEYAEMKRHPQYGYEMLKDEDIDQRIKLACLMHHERCDGSGYPSRLTTDGIEPFAMIISIADVYDAMTANRVYRAGLCPFDVIAEFQSQGIKCYHPQYIMVFLQHIADTYINADVLLSDGSTGKIVLINSSQLTRPLIQTDTSTFIDLSQRTDLYIQAII